MSYSSPRRRKFGLGADMVLRSTAPTLAPMAAAGTRSTPVAPAGGVSIDIIPPSCKAMSVGAAGQSQNAAAGQVVVMAWPFVTLDEAGVQRVLDGIYAGGAGGDAVLRAAIDSQAPPVSSGPAVQPISAPPNFIASGWMPEPAGERVADGRRSRGTLWLAFGWPVAVSARASRNFALRVLSALTGIVITQAGSGSEGLPNPIGPGGAPQIALDTSDLGLQQAAVRSAVGSVSVALALGTLFGAGPFARATATARTTSNFRAAVVALTEALTALQTVPSLAQQAAAAIEAARNANEATCAAATANAAAVVGALTQARTKIAAAGAAAQLVAQYARSETNPDTSKIVKDIRDEVLGSVNSSLEASRLLAVAKEHVKCITFTAAQRSLEAQLRSIAAEFADGQGKAAAIIGNGPALGVAIATADAAIASVNQARAQFCPEWYMKEILGLPTYAWLGGGVTTFLAIAVAVKARKKKAAAAGTKLAPNRRRTSRRTRSAS